MIEEFLKRGLKLTLHGSELRLNLPAVEAGAVVCQSQLEVPHPMGYSMCLGGQAIARCYCDHHHIERGITRRRSDRERAILR
jgi:hypothetical protein